MTLKQKLFELQGITMSKNADNPFFKSKYLSLEKLLAELNPILKKNKMVVFHTGKDGNVVTTLADVESDDLIESSFPIQEGIEPQKVGSAITYAKRYNLGMIFNIITDGDDDGNSTSPKNTGGTVASKADTSDLVCDLCGAEGLISYKKDPINGRPYCPNFRDHMAKKEKNTMVAPSEKLPTKNIDDFNEEMPFEK